MQLETERLIIRDILETDWKSIHNYTSMTEVTQHTAWGPNTEEDTREYVQFVLDMQQTQPRAGFELAICLKKEGILIGGVGLHIENTNAEIGYVLNPVYQEKGMLPKQPELRLALASIHLVYTEFMRNAARTTRLQRTLCRRSVCSVKV